MVEYAPDGRIILRIEPDEPQPEPPGRDCTLCGEHAEHHQIAFEGDDFMFCMTCAIENGPQRGVWPTFGGPSLLGSWGVRMDYQWAVTRNRPGGLGAAKVALWHLEKEIERRGRNGAAR